MAEYVVWGNVLKQRSRERPGWPRHRPSEEGSEPGSLGSKITHKVFRRGVPSAISSLAVRGSPTAGSVSELSGGWIGLAQWEREWSLRPERKQGFLQSGPKGSLRESLEISACKRHAAKSFAEIQPLLCPGSISRIHPLLKIGLWIAVEFVLRSEVFFPFRGLRRSTYACANGSVG